MNRREFLLAGTLTLAGLGMGCGQNNKSAVQIDELRGSRRDPSYREGHRLWTGDFPAKPTRTERCQAVVLGGGISGLSAAWRWKHAGLEDFLLLELEPSLGGNSRALTYPITSAPIAAHYLPVPNLEARAVRRVLREMDVLTDGPDGRPMLDGDHLCHSPQERLHYRGQWFEGLLPMEIQDSETAAQVEHFHQHILEWQVRRDSQGRKVFALPLHFSSREPEYLSLDRQTFASYADSQGWTSPILRWYLEYACRDDFGGSLSNCSAWAGLHYFASRDGGGLGDPDDILVWPEGNQRLVSHLASVVGAERCRSGSLVVGVKSEGDRVVVDYLDLAANERVRLEAEAAVYCLPTFTRPYVLGDKRAWPGFVYAPWVTANLSLSMTPQDSQGAGFVAWDNVVYETPSLGYVVATHQELAFDPLRPTVWTWYRPFPDGDPAVHRKELLGARWEDWSETVLAELQRIHPNIRQVCQQLDVTVLGHGMVRPSLNFIWGEEIVEARESQGRLFFGHGDLSGMSLFEESQFRGVLAAEDALLKLGLRSETYL